MNEFEITFLYADQWYPAQVQNWDNIYQVTAYNHLLKQTFGDVVMVEANGDFAWKNPGPEFYRYALAIATALKMHLGFDA